MHQSAILIVDRPARRLAEEISAALVSTGMWVAVRGFEIAPDTHETADLVIVGASASCLLSREGEAVRAWLMTNRARYRGQSAGAFNVQRSPRRWSRATAGTGALGVMSTRGFTIASSPVTFRVTDEAGSPATGQASRAHEWARTLVERPTAGTPSAGVLVGSGQRY